MGCFRRPDQRDGKNWGKSCRDIENQRRKEKSEIKDQECKERVVERSRAQDDPDLDMYVWGGTAASQLGISTTGNVGR